MEHILDIIMKRRSIRRYVDRPVEPEMLNMLLQAAMAAPSAMNSQPWEFVVVTEKEKMDQLRSVLLFGQYNAPAAIIVCGSSKVAGNAAHNLFWVQDCSAALENILIAAAGMGLGTVWIGTHPVKPNVDAVRMVLKIPRRITPLGVVYVGYPAEEKRPRTQYKEERVHWQQYSGKK